MIATDSQQKAIAARGNVLVMAGAGTGKTRTLVERCLDCLIREHPRLGIDEVLMVTFTDKAAAEMRQRIRKVIEQQARKNPADVRWAEQLALFERARIGTLHSFCYQLVQQNFFSLRLDPQLTVLSAEEAALHAAESLDKVLQRHYAGETQNAEAVQKLIETQGGGSDSSIRKLVLRIHHYTQTLPDPSRWFEEQTEIFVSAHPGRWEAWLVEGFRKWTDEWIAEMERVNAPSLREFLAALQSLPKKPSRDDCARTLVTIFTAEKNFIGRKKSDEGKLLETFLEESRFFESVASRNDGADPLVEDWGWVRDQMTALLALTQEFGTEFSRTKRELGVLDFHDLEQFALDLLWDRASDSPTELAHEWRQKLRFVFVDEYQDINAVQDKIICALSRDGGQANRFLVGDVKQSIYRFRLADPTIFRRYATQWNSPTSESSVVALRDNFRSREAILDFVNSFFPPLMRADVGGVDYHDEAALRFGAADERKVLSRAANPQPRVELHLKIKGCAQHHGEPDEENSSATLSELEEAEAEAHLIAARLLELKQQQHPVWDDERKQFRPATWRDMAILLRAPSNKAEAYAKEFQRAGVPLFVARGGFYESIEVLDLLSLLTLLDNPLQDIPAIAVLRSPLVGLTIEELAHVRLAEPRGHFWHAVQQFHHSAAVKGNEAASPSRIAWQKIDLFLERFRRWRALARQSALSRCLETVLSETFYESWALNQPRGRQRLANVRCFLGLARQFDSFQRQGLFRFLRFIEAQKLVEAEPDFPAAAEEDAVQLMSVHQSKGLEFPIVVVADLGKSFNFSDLYEDLILDEEFGLCPHVRPPHTGKIYPSLLHWLAKRRQKKELLGEELRLLYVAMTRSRDTLILSGCVSEKKIGAWSEGSISTSAVLKARSCADWLGMWIGNTVGGLNSASQTGEGELLRWFLHHDSEQQTQNAGEKEVARENLFNKPEWSAMEQHLSWQYSHLPATTEPAKTSVTILRRRYAEEELEPPPRWFSKTSAADAGLSATDRGAACHAFLQLVSLDQTDNLENLQREAARLQQDSVLLPEQVAALDLPALADFWKSDLGRRIRANAAHAHRELPFACRFTPNDLAKLVGTKLDASLDQEFVVVQGVADLAVLLPKEIWLVDFKTDDLTEKELPAKREIYEPQILFYAAALERIYKKPVTEAWLHFVSLRRSERIKT